MRKFLGESGAMLLACALFLAAGCTGPSNPVANQLGQLFCAKPAGTAGVLTVAILDAAGAAFLVPGLASGAVAAACALWDANAVPVSPPATPVPSVALPLKSAARSAALVKG